MHVLTQQPNSSLTLASLALALLMVSAPAQASEVVKLARLVITGKRLSAMPQARPAPQQLPRVLVEGRQGGAELRVAEDRRAQFRPI